MDSPYTIETKTTRTIAMLFEVVKVHKGAVTVKTGSGERLTLFEGDNLTFRLPAGETLTVED